MWNMKFTSSCLTKPKYFFCFLLIAIFFWTKFKQILLSSLFDAKSVQKIWIFKSLNNIFSEYLEIILYPIEIPKHSSNIWIQFKTFYFIYFIYFLFFLKLNLLKTVSWICLWRLGFSPAGSLSIVRGKKKEVVNEFITNCL